MPTHQHHHLHHGDHRSCSGNYNSSCHPSYCSCCCCCCNSSSSPPLPAPSPLPPISTEKLLQAMATQLLFQMPANPHLLQTQSLPKSSKDYQQVQSLVQSLILRVATLESSFSQLSSCSPAAPKPSASETLSSPRRRPAPPHPTLSLRDVAARTIQARFRRFLVRRSQTLRDLKRLAAFKSDAAALRSLISGESRMEPEILSQKVMDLLLQVDFIQSSDPMIREGKRSISRELARMLDFIDKVLVKERSVSLRALEITGNAAEDEAAPPIPYARSAKRVSFAENSVGTYDEGKGEDKGFGYAMSGGLHGKDGGLGLSAPLPAQMEPRTGL
ncbi:BAG family molecular chaperone regulator 8, chloroplastic [Apostasia shenzhenica]|uniref:BAG family molecular chaperone regulator 8, chloroplastic n=1 Tax=Apostasia shenzhenica TaxID=1088818 RepID=A0A2I0BAY0_9ASPA|nr:BAG family molecular chaperone regulator 8, chloroplastic [Apostasia shenzhenica]